MGLTLSEFLPYRLNCLSEAMSQEIKPIYRDHFGLNRPEWRVLVALADLGTATAKEIGVHSAQHKTRISRAVRALEQRRWLTRDPDPEDRRSEMLSLTAAGHRAYCDLVGPMRDREARILERLSPEERQALGEALGALERALGLAPTRGTDP
ncbi:MarR family winged helix-turn-helix transcriptional regulator [Sedimentitalea sp. XS_ASV28]|uniref:MarR family winged helix-turn-helix transcriptional regulator n=1 Tax=Sedimentitalea sp. XS_ASV28 TaxID=3241296 RepID=UPI003519AE7F